MVVVHICERVGPIVSCPHCAWIGKFTVRGMVILAPGDGSAHTGDAFRAWAGWLRLKGVAG